MKFITFMDAREYIKELGFEVGEFQPYVVSKFNFKKPTGFKKTGNVGMWLNLSKEERLNLDGIIVNKGLFNWNVVFKEDEDFNKIVLNIETIEN